jgi:uncharacterized protein YkwD
MLGCLALPREAHADALADVQLLRASGCGGVEPALDPVHHVDRLDRAAAQWAAGYPISAAAERYGYAARKLAGVHVAGSDAARLQTLRKTGCATLMNSELTDIGTYRRGQDSWLLLAAPSVETLSTPSAAFAMRVLALVNAARARGTSCGAHAFGPDGPVRSSTALDQVAHGHAIDMAEHVYFEHQDLAGRTPADRVRAAGYRERLVGENIAYGPNSPEEVVRGWLASVGHCENIMDPRFVEMGVAYAVGHAPQGNPGRGLYWVQVLADPTRS